MSQSSNSDHAAIVGRAFLQALNAHRLQTDKAGAPYVTHLARVALGVGDAPDAIALALLHDIVEDTEISFDAFAHEFPENVVDAVEALTKRANEPYESYLARVARDPLALRVKRADMADNTNPARLAQLSQPERNRLVAKYAKARKILDELARDRHA